MPRSNYAREPQLLSLRVWSLCSTTREAAIMRGLCTAMKSGPHLPQLQKALARKTKTQHSHKKKKKKKKITLHLLFSCLVSFTGHYISEMQPRCWICFILLLYRKQPREYATIHSPVLRLRDHPTYFPFQNKNLIAFITQVMCSWEIRFTQYKKV